MTEELVIGIACDRSFPVLDAQTVGRHGTVDLPVLATPHLIFMMEDTCVLAINPLLDKQQLSVGSGVFMDHLAPAYVGDRIDVRAELVSIRSRRLVFRVQARNGRIVVGRGLHERVIIDKSTFRAPGGKGGRP